MTKKEALLRDIQNNADAKHRATYQPFVDAYNVIHEKRKARENLQLWISILTLAVLAATLAVTVWYGRASQVKPERQGKVRDGECQRPD